MNKNNILFSSVFYSLGNMVGAGLNMLYQFVLMIFISIEDYGVIQPLLQFVGLLLLPVSAYQFALTKHFSEIDNLFEESSCLSRKLNYFVCGLSIVWLLLIPTFKKVFHVDDNLIFISLFVSLLLNTVQVPYICRLQAEKKFFTAGLAQIIQGITRIFLGVLCVWFFPTIWGAMLGVIVSNIAFVLGNTFEYRTDIFKRSSCNYTPKKLSLKLLFVSLGSVGMFSLLMYSDTVLVRALLPSDSALFASSNLLGKGMIFLTAGISFVVLPLMADKLGYSKKSLWIGFTCLLVLVACYVGFFYFTAPFLEILLFKGEPSIVGQFQKFMPYYNMMFIPYPLIYYFLNYYLVKENFFYPCLLLIGVGMLYGGIFYFHRNIYMITNVIGVVGYVLLVIVILHSIFSKDKGQIHEEYIDEHAVENLV
ncbi:MAG: hypothetical protein ACRC0X_06300 [Brevinema sp.]